MSDQEKSTDQASFDKYDYIRIPKEACSLLFETLDMDTRSSFFDYELQEELIEALEQVEWLNKKSLTRIISEEVKK